MDYLKAFMWVLCIVFLLGVTAAMPSEPRAAPRYIRPQKYPHRYYERPQYRYPYYDEKGNGQILYGYGGPDLYAYNTFQALEGFHRRR